MKLLPNLAALSAFAVSACALVPERTETARAEPLPEVVAQRLETVRSERAEYPSFHDIPASPSDVRTPAQWARAVSAVKGEGAALTRWILANPPEVAGAASYAAQARRELGVGPDDIPPPDQAARIEALARELRARTTPPPPLPE